MDARVDDRVDLSTWTNKHMDKQTNVKNLHAYGALVSIHNICFHDNIYKKKKLSDNLI